MSAWKRVPKTARARIQVENYLAGLRAPSHSFATVLRLARIMELRGIEPNVSIYRTLVADFPAYLDLYVLIVEEMKARERALPVTKTLYELQADGSLEPVGEVKVDYGGLR